MRRLGEPVLLGIDDTDGPNGGCTTHALTEVIRAAQGLGADLIGNPRLVRLNPNVPWKTRGNAALAARFGVGRGVPRLAGRFPEGPVHAYPRGSELDPRTAHRLVDAAWDAVDRLAPADEPRTDPALVAVHRPLPARLYRAAVRRVVTLREVRRVLDTAGAELRHRRRQRGLIGASAAVAWSGRRATFELVAYRSGDRGGTPRELDRASVHRVEHRYPELFLCTDPRTRRVMIAPHTACPVLLGLRATRPERLPQALSEIRGEPWERWIVFRTNQGTGDHVVPSWAGDLNSYDAASVVGRVATPPTALRGGHVAFALRDGRGDRLDCLVFEPSKTLPHIAQRLRVGDRLRVWGGRGRDRAFRVEGIEVRDTAARMERGPVPPCPECGGHLGSSGRRASLRCRHCRAVVPRSFVPVRPEVSPLTPGVYHPTPSARRHLAPLPVLEPRALRPVCAHAV
ncbi:MAG TPA: tRNA(Ile)(2)-agmatinylcytidine synthase [Thermoplasmata archaeon]|nr:tRNA(Ile)(2)-agmatinylcytidine synthase [Thermoplasmata archaeon]